MPPTLLNERLTENIVRRHLDKYAQAAGARVEEQRGATERIEKLLKRASKRGHGVGRPDFTVAFEEQSDFALVIECKADIARHQSPQRNQPADYAVDGALHYAKHVSREHNVLAIAVSGTRASALSVSHFWHLRGETSPEPADIPGRMLPLVQYLERHIEDSVPKRHGVRELGLLARRLNGKLHALKVTPAHRALLVSAILVSLQDKAFLKGYKDMDGERLLGEIRRTHILGMKKAGVESYGMSGIESSYGFMTAAGTGALTHGLQLSEMVSDIAEFGSPIIRRLEHYDAIGQFYLEFLRYSNNDAELGIVLTPPHITELASELTKVGKDDRVYDSCAGTGGFLIAAMRQMFADAKGDENKREAIRRGQIFGTEEQAAIVSLLHNNMYLHGDGKSNMKQGDCFAPQNIKWIKSTAPTVGLLNPPFKDKKMSGVEEMEFVLNNLSVLRDGGRCAAILPMLWTRAADGKQLELKRLLLSQHTLEAVVSLPDKLFYNSNASVVTCMMIITAGRPHAQNKKTWFAYGKDDGFEMRQHFGRVDRAGRWGDIRKLWVARFINRDVVPGFSIMRHVKPEDEWCAEAYIQADYGALTRGDYNQVVRDFELSKARAKWETEDRRQAVSSDNLAPLRDIFIIERGHALSYNQQIEAADGVNFVGRGSENNGVKGKIAPIPDKDPKPAGMLTVAASGSVLETFLQIAPFYTGVGTLCLRPCKPMGDKAKLFYCMLIRANNFRYNYGREANATLGEILLPTPKSIPTWAK